MSHIIKSVECPKQNLKSGEVLFKEGAGADCFFIVKKGSLAVFKNHGRPDEVKLAEIGEGRVLGEVASVDGLPRTATAIAISEVEVTKVSAATLRYALDQCPGWLRAIVLDLVERLRKTDDLLSSKGILNSNTQSSQKATANGGEA